jgi:uncharacterized protein YycO
MYQPFNILFHKGNSFIARLIRKISSGNYSHTTMLIDSIHCLETSWKNPSIIKHFNYRYKSYDMYRLNVQLTDMQKQIILQYITENIRTGYDWKYLFSRAGHLLFGTPIKNSKKYLTCDELIYEAFKLARIKLIEDGVVLTPSSLSKSKYLEKVNI